jgi:small conductance mechanosensitive channel
MNLLPDPIGEVLASFLEFLPSLISGLVIFIVSLYLAGLVSKLLRRALEMRESDPEITLFLTKITRWSIIILGVFAALQQVGFNLSAFLAGLGILGFTVGFALQDVSKNFVAGLLLLLQQPFDIGDVIEVSDFTGTVLDVDLRATKLKTLDGKQVLIPNADVFTSPITNFSSDPNRRLDITIGVAYDSDLSLVRETALRTVSAISGVLDDPAPQVVFDNFAPSTLDFTLYFWIDTNQVGILGAKDAAVTGINAAFDEKGIEMPFPVQTILLQQ